MNEMAAPLPAASQFYILIFLSSIRAKIAGPRQEEIGTAKI
jgi:hypothetical protein